MWVQMVVEELFTTIKAKLILRTPLSLRIVQEKLIWHFDRHGVFNRKNGYQVASMAEGF